ncbi:hypothetical protein HY212_01700 [Candidatus Pacearchaeota archaeon]|nr:hypothetical protein [Candidatus Pacearchaeota archaeon]
MKRMDNDKKTISISSNIFNIISDRIHNSPNEFSTVDEYVEYVLTELLVNKNTSSYSEDEEKKIEKHLKDMGYI